MFQSIQYKGDPLDGIIQHIKNQTKNEDIIAQNYAKIVYPSIRTTTGGKSSDVKVIFGIPNNTQDLYWSSVDDEINRYIAIYLKYPIILEGIAIRNNKIDWFKEYLINCSNDMITWDYQTTFSTTDIEPSFNGTQTFYFQLEKSTPCKFINITPHSLYENQITNYAFYRIELFGRILNPCPQVTPTGTKIPSHSLLFAVFILYH